MSKAEDRYLDLFQDGRLRNCSSKDAFLLGYHQAEKDLELGWEDMFRIDEITSQVYKDSDTCQTEVIYQEVLKRFIKERKEK
jgi:hypothetical protein